MGDENKNDIEQQAEKWIQEHHGPEGVSGFFNAPAAQSSSVTPPSPPAPDPASSSIAPAIDAASTGMQWLKKNTPDAAKPYVDSAVSVLGTAAGRSAARQLVPGLMYNHNLAQAGAQQEQNAKAQLNAIGQARVQQNIEHAQAVQSHAAQADVLRAELQRVEFEHQKAVQNHQTALAHQSAADIRNIDLEIERESRASASNRSALGNFATSTRPRVNPEFSPEGGPATEKYARQFGATEAQAKEVPSMSRVQQQTIPGNVGGIDQARSVDSTNRRVVGSELALLPEGQKAVAERNAASQLETERANMAQQQFEAEQRRIRLEKEQEIAKHRASAKLIAEEAERNRKEAQNAKNEATKALGQHNKNAPQKPPTAGISEEAKARAEEAYARKNQRIPEKKFLSTIARLGTRFAPRFAPVAGAFFAPIEADLARKDYQAGNYLRAGVHGSGAIGAGLQATGIPLAMGAGDIMQIAPFGLSIYDTVHDYANRNPNQSTQSKR